MPWSPAGSRTKEQSCWESLTACTRALKDLQFTIYNFLRVAHRCLESHSHKRAHTHTGPWLMHTQRKPKIRQLVTPPTARVVRPGRESSAVGKLWAQQVSLLPGCRLSGGGLWADTPYLPLHDSLSRFHLNTSPFIHSSLTDPARQRHNSQKVHACGNDKTTTI